jgi:hypothetical protein
MKPRKCPFCGEELSKYATEYNPIMDKWVLNHFCEKPHLKNMSVFIVGDTEEDIKEAWGYEDEESESL